MTRLIPVPISTGYIDVIFLIFTLLGFFFVVPYLMSISNLNLSNENFAVFWIIVSFIFGAFMKILIKIASKWF